MTTRSLRELAPNPRNPRTITAEKRKMLRDALARFGDLSGVVYNRQSKTLIGGHQRCVEFTHLTEGKVTVTRELNEPSITGTVAEGYFDMAGERFVYREVDWPEDVAAAAMIAANKGAGEWDAPQLKDWLGELDAQDFSLDLTMFNADERAALGAGDDGDAGDLAGDDGIVDEVPEPPLEPATRLGDMYHLGPHRLACMDSNDPASIDCIMAGDVADMVYTDPPYGINLETNLHDTMHQMGPGSHSRKQTPRARHRPIHGDDAAFDARALLSRFAGCKEIFLWGGDYFAANLPAGGSYVVWDKRSTADGGNVDGHVMGSAFELCWSRTKHRRLMARILWSGLCQGPKEGRRVHPTQKPVALTEWMFERWGNAGDIVVDLYGGSGSTLLACQKTGRQCRMLEIDPGYVDVIIARYEAATGDTAKLVWRDGHPVGNGVGMAHG